MHGELQLSENDCSLKTDSAPVLNCWCWSSSRLCRPPCSVVFPWRVQVATSSATTDEEIFYLAFDLTQQQGTSTIDGGLARARLIGLFLLSPFRFVRSCVSCRNGLSPLCSMGGLFGSAAMDQQLQLNGPSFPIFRRINSPKNKL